jgi:hypothetical protein
MFALPFSYSELAPPVVCSCAGRLNTAGAHDPASSWPHIQQRNDQRREASQPARTASSMAAAAAEAAEEAREVLPHGYKPHCVQNGSQCTT